MYEAAGQLESVARRLVMHVLLVLVGVGLLTASAWVSVPFHPVPMTMQTLAVLLIGGVLGSRLGAASVATYLMAGLAGAPVFHSGTSGPVVLLGPTGGYLIGFLCAAVIMGLFARRAALWCRGQNGWRRVVTLAVGAVLAGASVYAVGVPWLAVYLGDLKQAVAAGVVPFVLGDLLKMAVAVGALSGVARFRGKIG